MSSLLYSIRWKRVPVEHSRPAPRNRPGGPFPASRFGRPGPSRRRPPQTPRDEGRNLIAVEVTCLDEGGREVRTTKLYEEWLGVLTDRIDLVVREMKEFLPGIRVRYDRLGEKLYRKVLPYFAERAKLERGFDYEALPFYRVYVDGSCPPEEVGNFFRRYEIAYFRECDWHVRLYLDFCSRYPSESADCGFYYQWYRVHSERPMLTDAFVLLRGAGSGEQRVPNFTLAAFDIETVQGIGGRSRSNGRSSGRGGEDDEKEADFFKRIPDGTDPDDRIVMTSIVLWNRKGLLSEKILYLNPFSSFREDKKNYRVRLNFDGDPRPPEQQRQQQRRYYEYDSESDLLNDFHFFLKDAHVLTGYNVDRYDVPCIFARLLFLGRWDLLSRYTSRGAGRDAIATFENKTVLDLYPYFKKFSNYDLPGFKLDDVARAKLGEEKGKIAVDSVGIQAWYDPEFWSRLGPEESLDLCRSDDPERCRRALYSLGREALEGEEEEEEKSVGRGKRVVPLDKFGTFRQYCDYCLRDSQVARELFEKESVLGFLTARSQFAAVDAVEAMHYGNSRFLLEVFQTSGTLLGYFVNVDFFSNRSDHRKYASVLPDGAPEDEDDDEDPDRERNVATKYQGALNYRCPNENTFENVAVLDFGSMYPTALLSSNLCYGTCDILTLTEYRGLSETCRRRLTAVPYRRHAESDFEKEAGGSARDSLAAFRYPEPDPTRDEFVIVSCEDAEAFLPALAKRFLKLRREHDGEWKRTRDVWHYNAQLCIKILLNSLYGTTAAKTTPLAYVPIAMSVAALARYQLLAAFRHVRDVLRYTVCYADTDGLMVREWPDDHCERLDDFFRKALPHVRVKFEKRMERLVVVSKKRYFHYDCDDAGGDEKKKLVRRSGFGKKINGLVRFMYEKFMRSVLELDGKRGNPSEGWSLWVETLLEARYMCRDPRKYAVTRKARKLSEYKSKNCAIVKMLKKYPEKENDYVDYAFGRADVAKNEETNWVMAVEDCQYVNFEKLFSDHKRHMSAVLDVGFPDEAGGDVSVKRRDAVLNALRWKYFVHAELLHRAATGRKLAMLMERGVKYTFRQNDHLFGAKPPPPQTKNKRKQTKRKGTKQTNPKKQKKTPCLTGDEKTDV